jgi:hypothetical protein
MRAGYVRDTNRLSKSQYVYYKCQTSKKVQPSIADESATDGVTHVLIMANL